MGLRSEAEVSWRQQLIVSVALVIHSPEFLINPWREVARNPLSLMNLQLRGFILTVAVFLITFVQVTHYLKGVH